MENKKAMVRLMALREKLFGAIKRALAVDGHCKSYEGAFSVCKRLPSYFNDPVPNPYYIELHCYVIGPSCHYAWEGRTLLEAVEKAEIDVSKWIRESDTNIGEDYKVLDREARP